MSGAREETDLVRRAMGVDHLFLALGHETFEAEGARFVRDRDYPGIHDANHVSGVSADTPEAVERLLVRADREFAHCATSARTPSSSSSRAVSPAPLRRMTFARWRARKAGRPTPD